MERNPSTPQNSDEKDIILIKEWNNQGISEVSVLLWKETKSEWP